MMLIEKLGEKMHYSAEKCDQKGWFFSHVFADKEGLKLIMIQRRTYYITLLFLLQHTHDSIQKSGEGKGKYKNWH